MRGYNDASRLIDWLIDCLFFLFLLLLFDYDDDDNDDDDEVDIDDDDDDDDDDDHDDHDDDDEVDANNVLSPRKNHFMWSRQPSDAERSNILCFKQKWPPFCVNLRKFYIVSDSN